MKRNRGNKYMNAKPTYQHRVPTTKELGAQARRFKCWHAEGLIWRTVARNSLFARDVAVPTAEERRRREIMLARLLLLAVEIVLAGEPLGLETARDLGRELRHCYPELVDEVSKTVERRMHRTELLDHQPVPVRTDVFLHHLEPFALQSLRRAIERGLVPSGLILGR